MKIIIALFLLAILATLTTAGFFMIRRPPNSEDANKKPDRRMARALGIRVALSITLFGALWMAYALGWIQPTGLGLNR